MEMPISRDAKRTVPRFLAQGQTRREPNLADMAQHALVETFTPASVLVTRRYQVLYVYGDTSDYLVHPPGELTDDLMSVTRSELRLKTRAAVHQAISENRQLIVHGAKVMRGDLVRLTRVFTNLLSNAISYTPDGGHILITLTEETGKAIGRVRDNGSGIRPEDMAGLFGLFSRLYREHDRIRGADGLSAWA